MPQKGRLIQKTYELESQAHQEDDTPVSESAHTSGEKGILVVDDHPIVRQGLKMLIDQEPDLAVCAEAEGAAGALRAAEQSEPDAAIVDLSLKDGDGLELLKDMRVRYPNLPVLVLSWRDESFAERALRAGAMGYVSKKEEPERVLDGIRAVLAGRLYVSQTLASDLITQFVKRPDAADGSAVRSLSDRELEVFELLGKGIPTSRIAKVLHISVKTVESHRGRIKRKLNLANATELVMHAVQWVQSQDGG